MKIVLTNLFLILSILMAHGQLSQGDQLRRAGNLEGAIKAYKEAYIAQPDDMTNTYNLACAMALTYQMPDSAFHYLNLALKNDQRLWVLADPDLISLSEDARWMAIRGQQLEKFQQHNGKLAEPDYALKLLSIIQKDQALDYYIDLAKNAFMEKGHVPHWYYPLGKMRSDLGGNNFENVELLLQKYGWPTYSKVGELAADALLLAINHHERDEIRKQYIDQVKEACLAGEGSCMEFAKIQDRILVNDNQPQIYGMQFKYNAQRELVPFPITEPEYVDERRSKIGLEPLKVYLKRKIGYDWKVEQLKR